MHQREDIQGSEEARRRIRRSTRRLRFGTFSVLLVALFLEFTARAGGSSLLSDCLSITALSLLCGISCYLLFRLPDRPLLKGMLVTACILMVFSEVIQISEDYPAFDSLNSRLHALPHYDFVQHGLLLIGVILTLLVYFLAMIGAVAAEQLLAEEKRDLNAEVEERKRTASALERSREELRGLSLHIEEVREEERKRIAREVHDELGQTLTLLKMDLSTLELDLRRRGVPELEDSLAAMQRTLADTMQSVRKIISELRPGLLDDLGLAAATEWQCREFERRTGVLCNAQVERWEPRLSEEKATALFRILQEALTNVAKHAHATRVEISLKRLDTHAILTVADNGAGMAVTDLDKRDSYGLRGMRERARQLNGDVDLESAQEQGTLLRVRMPL